jgi:type IV pilus assembly protein PilB
VDPRTLNATRLFSAIPAAAGEALSRAATVREAAVDEWLLVQGEPARDLLIVLEGRADVVTRDANDGLEYFLAQAGPGDDLGLAEVLGGAALLAGAFAGTPVRVAVIPGAALRTVMRDVPAAAAGMLQLVASRWLADRSARSWPVVDLDRLSIDESVWDYVPRAVMMKCRALPLARHGSVLVTGFADPGDSNARDEVQRAVPGLRLRPVTLDAPGFERFFRTRVAPVLDRRTSSATQGTDSRWFTAVKFKPYNIEFVEGFSSVQDDKGPQVPGDQVVAMVNRILGEALDLNASDIHLEPNETDTIVRYRVDGHLRRRPENVERRFMAGMATRLKALARMDIAERRRAQDGRIGLAVNGRRVDLRMATVPTRFGERLVMRILDPGSLLIDLERLMPIEATFDAVKGMLEAPQGMIIVAGPTGSGKTTTIYSQLLSLRKSDINILSIEDPIEYSIEGVTQVQVNDAAGVTFATAVRNFLRQDPDVIVVGEVRDTVTAGTSVEAALTGHLVITSLHANDALGSVVRMREMGVEPFLLAHTIVGVISQRLARRICPQCRTPTPYPRDLVRPFAIFPEDGGATPYELFKGRGCSHCNYQGYRGRTAVFETLRVDERLRPMIAKGADIGELEPVARAAGLLLPMRDYVRHLLVTGVTTPEEIARVLFAEGAAT